MAMFSNETLDPELYSDVVAEKEEFEKNEELVKYYKYQEDLGRPFECDQVGPQIVFHENPQPENKDKFYNPIRIDYSTQTPGYLADVAVNKLIILYKYCNYKFIAKYLLKQLLPCYKDSIGILSSIFKTK